MKKMIPVYLLQIVMLAAFLFVTRQIVNELQSMRTELKTELANTKVEPYGLQKPRSPEDQAMRVVIVGQR